MQGHSSIFGWTARPARSSSPIFETRRSFPFTAFANFLRHRNSPTPSFFIHRVLYRSTCHVRSMSTNASNPREFGAPAPLFARPSGAVARVSAREPVPAGQSLPRTVVLGNRAGLISSSSLGSSRRSIPPLQYVTSATATSLGNSLRLAAAKQPATPRPHAGPLKRPARSDQPTPPRRPVSSRLSLPAASPAAELPPAVGAEQPSAPAPSLPSGTMSAIERLAALTSAAAGGAPAPTFQHASSRGGSLICVALDPDCAGFTFDTRPAPPQAPVPSSLPPSAASPGLLPPAVPPPALADQQPAAAPKRKT